MSVMTRICAAICAMALPVGAWAQDAATGDDAAAAGAETEAAEAADQGVGDSLPMGVSEVGTVYVAESFSDWDLRCVRTEDGKDPCQLYQLLNDVNGNSVAEITLFTVSGSGQAVGGATVITPLETLLTANLRLAVDAGNAKVYPYSFCSRKGCHARLGFTEEDIAAFRKGATATIAIVPAAAPDERVDLTVSLTGFTAGWNALVEANKAAQGE